MQGPPGGMQPGMQGTMGGRPVCILCGLLPDDDLMLTADDATWHAAWSDGNHGRATGESIVLDGGDRWFNSDVDAATAWRSCAADAKPRCQAQHVMAG